MSRTNADESRELAKNSSDCSFLLTHLIRQNTGKTDHNARLDLKSILGLVPKAEPLLRASTVGWYGTSSGSRVFNPSTGELDGQVKSEGVCFTESTLAGLRAHRDLFEVKYGLAFDRDDLFAKGANPCINISKGLLRTSQPWHKSRSPKYLYNFVPEQLQPFVNVIHSSFDATHEREWRHPGDMQFKWADLKFVFCPEVEFKRFAAVQVNAMPCLFDLAWLDRI